MNNESKILISFCLFLLLGFQAFSQDDEFMQGKKDGTEVYELPVDKFSQSVQTSYTELLSQLTTDKNKLNKDIGKLNSEKNSMLKAGSRDIVVLNRISKSVTEKSKELIELDKDISLLKSALSGDSNEKRAVRIINTINSKRYGIDPLPGRQEKWVGKAKKTSNLGVIKDPECGIEENGIDPTSLKSKIKIASESIIEYTHPKLESFYKEESFLTADAGVMLVDKTYFFVLDVVVNSRDATRTYGDIESGAPLKALLINGEAAYMFATSTFKGQPIPNEDKVRYQSIFVINKADYRLLKKSELSKLGMMWSSGYEEYEIYNIDIVMNQLECLDKYK